MDHPTTAPICSVLLLAGGRGQRMGGADKGLLPWRGKPMIRWLSELVRPLTDDLLISCNRNAEQYAHYADRLVSDEQADFQGPLAGIQAGLGRARHSHLLVLPCDAPQVDRDLLEQLLSQRGTRPVVAAQGAFLQPLFAVIPSASYPSLQHAWQAGERSPQRWLRQLDPLAIQFADDDPRFANFNTPERLLN